VASGIVHTSAKLKSYGGIGAGFHTFDMSVNVEMLKNNIDDSRLFLENENTFRFWLNKTAYSEDVSAYRVTWLGVTSNTGEHLAGTSIRREPGAAPDAADYIAADTTANRNEGKNLWDNKTLIARPGEGNIRAKCMDCHTKTGYDLKYFGYTNESIYKRSRFHGLSDIEAKKLTRYIRNLATDVYGRPWNPPYQPGEVSFEGNMVPLSSRPVERWAAGAGSSSVLKKDEDMLSYVFPDTNNNGAVDQAEVDAVFKLSPINPGASYLGIKLSDVPIHLQLPDWNSWLPRVHPMDIWGDFKNVISEEGADPRPDPYKAYTYLKNTIEGTIADGVIPNSWRISRIMQQTMSFSKEGANESYITSRVGTVVSRPPRSNVFRDASRNNTGRLNVDVLANSSAPFRDEMFDEKAKLALTKWAAVKYFEIHHVGKLEDKLATVLDNPNLVGERGWGSWTSAVFHIAPHKIARNARYFEGSTNTYDASDYTFRDADDQTPLDGDYESTVWYYLEAILNSGNKRSTGCCGSVDWGYNYGYYKRLASSSEQPQAMLYVATLMKEWQARNITAVDPEIGTEKGLNLRTATPVNAYAIETINHGEPQPNSDTLLALDEYSPNLYRYFLNTTLRRWMEVVKHSSFEYRYSTNSALNKLDRWPRSENADPGWGLLSEPYYLPTGWGEGPRIFNSRNLADSFWRLLPMLRVEGVDEVLLEDLKNWSKAAWPGPAGNLNDWDSRL
ncbi:hypothetical protein MNBD_GAMMA03-83, partial [hydrothermal vent metagenome]